MPSSVDKYFASAHLPDHLRKVSEPFSQLRFLLDSQLPDGPEKTVCFRKLLESKDCAVRAALDIPREGK